MSALIPNNKKRGNKKPLLNMYWMYGIIILSLIGLYYFQDGSQTKEVDWTEFEKAATEGYVEKIVVLSQNGIAEGYLTPEGAKAEKFVDNPTSDGDKKIECTIPSAEKMLGMPRSWLPGNLK